MKDRCPKSVGDAKQTLEIRVSQKGAAKDTDGNKSLHDTCTMYLSCTYTMCSFLKMSSKDWMGILLLDMCDNVVIGCDSVTAL